ncbi:MAG: exodeoxyribonuclease V subunit alpha [Rhodoferax sp.]
MNTSTFTPDHDGSAASEPSNQIDIDIQGESSAQTSDGCLTLLHSWADLGWLRRLDSAMAAFMLELDPSASPALLVSTAVLSQMESRGHTCLPLSLLVTQPDEILAWPVPAQPELSELWTKLPASLPMWLSALRISPLVRFVDLQRSTSGPAQDADHGQPLILSGSPAEPLLYLRRYWLHEGDVASEVIQRATAGLPVNEAVARQWLDRLFDASDKSGAASNEFDWQKLACAVALRAGLTVITGGPGTGKTYTAARLLALLFAMDEKPHQLRVALAAPTGKAAARLRQSIDASLQELSARLGDELDLATFTKRIGAARTLHSLLGARPDTRQFGFSASHLLDVDVLIVDEASMVHLEMMSALLQAMPRGARLILLGDKDQLASVEAGAVLGDLCRDATQGNYDSQTARYALSVAGQTLPKSFLASDSKTTALTQQTVMLRKSRRFGGLIGKLALAVNAGDCVQAQRLINPDPTGVLQATCHPSVDAVLELAVQGRPGATACYGDYLRLISQRPASSLSDEVAHEKWVKEVLVAFDRFRILCAVHDGDFGTRGLNKSVEQALRTSGLLKPRGEWYAGRPVMVTRNDPELGVFNGDVGVTLPGRRGVSALRVYFLDGDGLRSVGVSRLAHVETAYALTVHKCQGSEFLHTAVVLSPGAGKVLTRELVYTGITRARENFTLIEGEEGLLYRAIERKSQRASGLGLRLEGPPNTDL